MTRDDPGAPQVSVVVRSMARPTLDAALASIAAQRGVAAEVVVVAACGPAHPPLPPRCGAHALRLVAGAGRLPRAAAANAGLAAARGTWITFLDDDDVFLPDHLAGLLAATAQAPQARVVTSYAKGVFRDGHVEWFGQPFSLMQLYERNFIHLSAALFARELVDAGCRFDESFAILEDWEFMLQLAQKAAFHFVPLGSFQWHADAGDSGAAGGANHDAAAFAAHRDRVYAKWAAAHDALAARTRPLLAEGARLAQDGRLAEADAKAREALAVSANDPWALNLRAMILRAAGRLADARAVPALAGAGRPPGGGFHYNLALLDQAAGDADAARRNVRKALAADAHFAPALALSRELGER
ncbi:MAG: glycosyltransferase [Burkholderiales bacterium]|nr:glycosyltransferase [Burkholderiales bacterium]